MQLVFYISLMPFFCIYTTVLKVDNGISLLAAIKKYHRLGDWTSKNKFSYSSGGWKSRSKMSRGLISSEASLFGLQTATSSCAFTWSFLRVCRILISSSCVDTSHAMGPNPRPHFYLITSLKSSSNAVTAWGSEVRTSVYEFGGGSQLYRYWNDLISVRNEGGWCLF